jgi:hypothetical protein
VDLTQTSFGGTGGAGDAPFGSAPAFSGGAGTPTAAPTGGGFLDKLSDPRILMAAAPLAVGMLNQGSTTGEAGVQKAAGEAATMGRTLGAFQMSGTLPGGLQAVVDQQSSAGEAALKSSMAEMGLSGSTMEAQQLAQLKQVKAAQVATIADNLARQGLQWSQLSAQEFGQLMQTQSAQDTAFTNALGKFAAGLAGSVIGDKTGTGTG